MVDRDSFSDRPGDRAEIGENLYTVIEAASVRPVHRLGGDLHYEVSDATSTFLVQSDGRSNGRVQRSHPDMSAFERAEQG